MKTAVVMLSAALIGAVLVRGDSVVFDVNNISTFIRNNGSFNRNPGNGNSGFEWPKGTGNTAIYASGIWVGGKVGGDARVAVAEYSYEYDAGPIRSGINPEDPRWKMYKIVRSDTTGTNPDYDNWPYREGAPFIVTAGGDTVPRKIGDMTVWTVFNDNNPTLHTNKNTLPLGIEVQLTAYASNLQSALGNSIFYKWKLINKSGVAIESTYVTIWADVDLGDSGDDYNGCDTTRSLGYTYNGNPTDGVYGSMPPAVGFDLLQGPLVPGAPTDTARFPDGRRFPGKKLLNMTSFITYSNSNGALGNPQTGQEVFNYQKGVDRFGGVVLDNNGAPTTRMYSGDPTLPAGASNWIETGQPGDRRFMISAGPFTMADGDTQEIVAANIIARGSTHRISVSTLKNASDVVQHAYEQNDPYLAVEDRGELPRGFRLYQNYPNPFNPNTVVGYSIGRRGHVTLRVYNLLGQEVATLVDEVQEAGSHQTRWEASGMTSGVYFCSLAAEDMNGQQRAEVRKMVLLK